MTNSENTMQQGGFQGNKGYVASPQLLETVNVAMALEKPLLVKGEPGTGKTMLAEAVAEALGMPLITWSIKSTTKASEGLYQYDTVRRLYDGQFGEGDVKNIAAYVELGKLGQAFTADEKVVLLIDEIDKADIEFPNDLLWELDRMEFYIPETKETVTAKERPLVIITSNAEKELPDAFLRRCVFHYIDFPDEALMREIVAAHFDKLEEELVTAALKRFYELRQIPTLQKKPATSELLDWIRALQLGGVDISRVESEIPYLGILLKKDEDLEQAQMLMK